MIVTNGGAQFPLDDVGIVTATVDLEGVRIKLYEPLRGLQAVRAPKYRHIESSFSLSPAGSQVVHDKSTSKKQKVRYHAPEDENAFGPACWLGPFTAIKACRGGVDSCAAAVIVFSMCRIVAHTNRRANNLYICTFQVPAVSCKRMTRAKRPCGPKSWQLSQIAGKVSTLSESQTQYTVIIAG